MTQEPSREWIITSSELVPAAGAEQAQAAGWTSATPGAAAADGAYRADLVARIKAMIQSPDFDIEARLDAIVPDVLRAIKDPD